MYPFLRCVVICGMLGPVADVLTAGEPGEGQEAKALFEAKCGSCHGLDRSLSAVKTAAEWTVTVNRMARRAPDSISAPNTQAIAAYLAARTATRAATPQPRSAVLSEPAPAVHWTSISGAITWVMAAGTMVGGLLRKRLGRAFALHKVGALAAAIVWVLHVLSTQAR